MEQGQGLLSLLGELNPANLGTTPHRHNWWDRPISQYVQQIGLLDSDVPLFEVQSLASQRPLDFAKSFNTEDDH